MSHRSTRLLAVSGTAVLALLLTAAPAPAAPPTDPAAPATFTRIDLDTNLVGAAFSTAFDIYGTGKQDVIATSYGTVGKSNPNRPFTPDSPGTLRVYRQGATIDDWTRTTVFDESAGIIFPSQPTLTDVDGDGDTDIIQPAGWFFDSWDTSPDFHEPQDRGSITWWENDGEDEWVRHDVITDQPWSFHAVEHVDLDGDGVEDLVTTGEQGGNPLSDSDDTVATMYFKGNGDATFQEPVFLSSNGGSLPVVTDLDGDGKLDIVTAQYFGDDGVTTPTSYVWLQQVGEPDDDVLGPGNFETHTISASEGKAFQIKLVPNFRGDGVDRWVGTNHAGHPALSAGKPTAGVFELNPGSDLTAPWTSTRLSTGIQSRQQNGQAAPGVFGSGDLDGDGDVDLAVSGDGDHRVFWIEQKWDGTFTTHTLVDYDPDNTAEKPGFGQAGGAYITDLDGDGRNEIGFTSFDRNTVAIWTRQGGGPAVPSTVTSALSVTAAGTVTAGATKKLDVTLRAADAGPARTATVTFRAARTGATRSVGQVSLTRSGAGTYRGSITVTSTESGVYTAAYTGRTVSAALSDTNASATSTITTRSTVTGFATKKQKLKGKKRVRATVTVRPGFGRTVTLQARTCTSKKPRCGWKTKRTVKVDARNKAVLSAVPPKGASSWRVRVPATKAGTAVTTKVRKVQRR